LVGEEQHLAFTQHGKLPQRKDQPHFHAIALEKFLVVWNVKFKHFIGKWHLSFMTFNIATTTKVKPARLFPAGIF